MNRADWSRPTARHIAERRAAGRRRHNALRRRLADARLDRLIELSIEHNIDFDERGAQVRLSRLLGVSRSTVCRDVARVLAEDAAAEERSAEQARERAVRASPSTRDAAAATFVAARRLRELLPLLRDVGGLTIDGTDGRHRADIVVEVQAAVDPVAEAGVRGVAPGVHLADLIDVTAISSATASGFSATVAARLGHPQVTRRGPAVKR